MCRPLKGKREIVKIIKLVLPSQISVSPSSLLDLQLSKLSAMVIPATYYKNWKKKTFLAREKKELLTRVRTKVSERTPNFDQKLPTYCCPLSLYSGGESAQLSLNFLKKAFFEKLTRSLSFSLTFLRVWVGMGTPATTIRMSDWFSDWKTCTFD